MLSKVISQNEKADEKTEQCTGESVPLVHIRFRRDDFNRAVPNQARNTASHLPTLGSMVCDVSRKRQDL